MLDPLSLALAVIALATVVKDTIKVFDKLKDAFSEVEWPDSVADATDRMAGANLISQLPEGYAQAKMLMFDIHKTLNAMQEAYSEKMEDQREAPALKKSLNELCEWVIVTLPLSSNDWPIEVKC